jgi:hypothetical protein
LRLAVRDDSTGQIGSMEIGLPLPPEPRAAEPDATPKPATAPAPSR